MAATIPQTRTPPKPLNAEILCGKMVRVLLHCQAMPSIEISVIVPARNASGMISGCIEALKTQNFDPARFEIIVVDDGSGDETGSIAKTAGAIVVRTDPRGPAAARNAGAVAARGEIILFTDADCRPEPDWIHQMVQPFEDRTVSGVKGTYRTDQTDLTARFVQAEYESKYRYMARFDRIDFIDTYSAGFRRDVFLTLNGYDESFPGASVEDQEFSFRMHEAGYKMVFVPRAVVRHTHADSLKSYHRKKYNIGFWKMKVVKNHPDKMVRDTHTPQELKLQIPVALILPVGLAMVPWLGWSFFFVLLAGFIGLGYREIRECAGKRDLPLTLSAPFFMLIRSWGLGMGMAAGIFMGKRADVSR
ncbi:glycosyltransferase [bacterium]|nr:glycosyltransferase [candidate division CSSED10-310 bacterium]